MLITLLTCFFDLSVDSNRIVVGTRTQGNELQGLMEELARLLGVQSLQVQLGTQTLAPQGPGERLTDLQTNSISHTAPSAAEPLKKRPRG
jgi:hypothetical protein